MDETVLVKTIDDVSAGGMLPGLSKVHVKATHNSGARNPRLVPMPSDSPGILKLGLYVERNALAIMTPVVCNWPPAGLPERRARKRISPADVQPAILS
jgi:hypothetical protein